MNGWVVVPGVYRAPNPRNAGFRSTMVFCRSGFVEVKTFLRKPMHQHDVSRNPLNPVGCQPVASGLSKFSNLLALVRAYSQVLKNTLANASVKRGSETRKFYSCFPWGWNWRPCISNQRIFLAKGLRCLENSGLLSFQHCQGDTIQKTETVKRIVLSQWALLDTCMCALCWALVIDMNWLAAWKAR